MLLTKTLVISMLPNEVKRIELEQKFYDKNPTIVVSSLKENKNVFVKKVYRKYFIVENCTNDNVKVNCIISAGKKQIKKAVADNNLFLNVITENLTEKIVYPNYLDYNLDLLNFVSYTPNTDLNFNIDFNNSTFVKINDQESFDFNSKYTDLTNRDNLILHSSSLNKKITNLNLKVSCYVVKNSNVKTEFVLPFKFVRFLYKNEFKAGINYNSSSSIISDNKEKYKFTYRPGHFFEDVKELILPSTTNEVAFFTLDIQQTLQYAQDLKIILLPFSQQDDIPIYQTFNPENPSSDRTLAFSLEDLSNYNNYIEISNRSNLDASKYYFWLDSIENAWYFSIERYPFDI